MNNSKIYNDINKEIDIEKYKIIKNIFVDINDDDKNNKIDNENEFITLINNEITKQINKDILNKLTDEKLLDDYLKCKSVNNAIYKLTNVLKDVGIQDNIIREIKNKYILELIPVGTKGVIRGNKFNKIVREYITNLKLDKKTYEICFEKKCENIDTFEIPDWYIKNINTNKVIIGMNQLDLWSGGQQKNRGSKYLIDCKFNNDKTKLLCVVCNEIKFKTKKNKAFNFFEIGFKNDTLCYLNNLETIIKKFLDN
jgi:hypothetical protein